MLFNLDDVDVSLILHALAQELHVTKYRNDALKAELEEREAAETAIKNANARIEELRAENALLTGKNDGLEFVNSDLLKDVQEKETQIRALEETVQGIQDKYDRLKRDIENNLVISRQHLLDALNDLPPGKPIEIIEQTTAAEASDGDTRQ